MLGLGLGQATFPGKIGGAAGEVLENLLEDADPTNWTGFNALDFTFDQQAGGFNIYEAADDNGSAVERAESSPVSPMVTDGDHEFRFIQRDARSPAGETLVRLFDSGGQYIDIRVADSTNYYINASHADFNNVTFTANLISGDIYEYVVSFNYTGTDTGSYAAVYPILTASNTGHIFCGGYRLHAV